MSFVISRDRQDIRYDTVADLLEALESMVPDRVQYNGVYQFQQLTPHGYLNKGYCTFMPDRPTIKRRFSLDRNYGSTNGIILSKLHTAKKVVFDVFYLSGHVAPLGGRPARQYGHTVGVDSDIHTRLLRLIYWTTESSEVLYDLDEPWRRIDSNIRNYLCPAPEVVKPKLKDFDSSTYLSALFTPTETTLLVKRITAV